MESKRKEKNILRDLGRERQRLIFKEKSRKGENRKRFYKRWIEMDDGEKGKKRLKLSERDIFTDLELKRGG